MLVSSMYQHVLCMQAHHVTRQVEYRGDVISLTEALVGFPAGGQVLLSDSTYQRIYGRLHTLHLKETGASLRKKSIRGTTLCCHAHNSCST